MKPVVFAKGYSKQAISAFPDAATDRIGANQSYVGQAQSRTFSQDDDLLSGGETFLLLTALSTLAATILMALP